MGLKKKKLPHLYIPWFTSDEDFYDDDEGQTDSWIAYLRRNLMHPVGEESPFPYSSWSYANKESSLDEEDMADKKSDVSLHDEIHDAFYNHPDVDGSNIKTIVLNGIVCLFGTVKSLLEKKEATRIAESISGVWKVRNELEIIL